MMSNTGTAAAVSNRSSGSTAFMHRIRATSFWGIVPFLLFTSCFLLWPIFSIAQGSITNHNGRISFSAYKLLFTGIYKDAFISSFKLSFFSAILAGVLGAILTFAISKTSGAVKSFTSSAAGVLANTGGIPLAFMFVAAFGQDGMVTKILLFFHWDIYAGSFDLGNFWGILLVYCFFQIPLMVIIFTPAVENMRKEWNEANDSLGGNAFQFFRFVTAPLLFPAFVSSALLLFASAFSAYATARAMTIGNLPLVPLLIGNLVNGDVIASEANLGDALAMGMVFVSGLAIIAYLGLLRFSKGRS
jgi:putative spermidine/putrescine transport system permease protein